MISYEDIKKANDSVVKTAIERKDRNGNVSSKDYVEVNQRVKAFRMVYPTGSIETFQAYLDGELGSRVVGFTCNIYATIDGERVLLSSGTAEEKENSTFINKTSFIENAETSSVGRALGFAGFGIDTSIASLEEVENAMNNQDKPTKVVAVPVEVKVEYITTEEWKMLNNMYSKEQIKEMYKELNISNGKQIPKEYAKAKIDEALANIKNELPAKEFY